MSNAGDEKSRREQEERFHDEKYSAKNKEPAHYKCNPTYIICRDMLNDLGDLTGKAVLECGCGNGWMTAELAGKGATVYAFDISGESVVATKSLLAKKNLARNCFIEKKAAEDLDYQEKQFDVILGFAILHHVDMNKVVPQLFRYLKPGGSIVFAEPLRGNPFLDAYRKLTPDFRTVDERPFTLAELDEHFRIFSKSSHREYYATALLPLFMTNISCLGFMKSLVPAFLALDKKLFAAAPVTRNYAWYTVYQCQK